MLIDLTRYYVSLKVPTDQSLFSEEELHFSLGAQLQAVTETQKETDDSLRAVICSSAGIMLSDDEHHY